MWDQAKDKNLGDLSKRVRELFDYNPDDGHLRWKVARQRVNKGDRAGYINRSDGYRYVCFDYNELLVHRVIWLLMTGKWPKSQIDHKNGIRDDNRWNNLREANNSQNNRNRSSQRNNKLGVKGVNYDPVRKLYRARITIHGKSYTIGRYKTFEEAIEIRKLAEEEFYGDFKR